MGATTGHKRINTSLSFKHEQFRLDSLDSLIDKGFDLVKDTELLRCKFTPLWNELIKKSGAIVLDSPHFQSAINGTLMKISCDLNGNLFKNVSILQLSPFLLIDKGELDISTDSILIIEAFKSVSQYSIDNAAHIEELGSSYAKYTQESGILQKDHENYFSSRGVPPCDIISNSKKLKRYLRTFKSAYDTCLQMKKYVNEVSFCLKEYEDYCKNEEVMMRFESIGRQAHRNSMTNAAKIMYKFSPEKKIANYEDYYDKVIDFAKTNRNCEQVLDFYNLTMKEEAIRKKKSNESLQKINKEEGKERNNKMIEESKNESNNDEIDDCRECKKSKEGICDLCKSKMEFNKEIETMKKEKDVSNNNNMVIAKSKNDINNEPQLEIEEDDDDIIDNIDSDEIQDSNEDIKEIAKTLKREEEAEIDKSSPKSSTHNNNGFKSLDKLHLIETINIYPQPNVYPTSFVCADRKLFATGLSNGALVITNTADLTEEKIILRHNKKITAMIYLNDGKTIISGSKDGNIYKHSLDTYESSLIGTEESIESIVNLFNDYSILVASNSAVISYDYVNNKKLYSFIAHDDIIEDMAYDISKDMLVTCSKDKKIKLWNGGNQECIGELKGIANSITSLCYAHRKDQFLVVSASKDCFVTFWNLSDKNLTKSIKMKTTAIKLIYLGNEKNVLAINDNNSFTIFDLETNEYKEFGSDTIKDSNYTSGLYFGDGNTFALGTRNAFVQLWEAK